MLMSPGVRLLKTGRLSRPHNQLIIDFFIIPTLHVDLSKALKHTVISFDISYSEELKKYTQTAVSHFKQLLLRRELFKDPFGSAFPTEMSCSPPALTVEHMPRVPGISQLFLIS